MEYTDLIRLSNSAIATVEIVIELEQSHQVTLAFPQSVFQGTLLAACTLLKLSKSSSPGLSLLEKEQTNVIFSAISIIKSMSVENNDFPAKSSEILSQLWSSHKAHRDMNGTYVPELQVRNRISMNVVFDCMWWWMKLFVRNPSHISPELPLHDRTYSSISGLY